MDFTRFYNLENYLFSKHFLERFQKNGYLSSNDFFCIVIWKANRSKTAIKRKMIKMGGGNLERAVKDLTNEIFKTDSLELKMEIMIKKWMFQLPMASAILSVLYPNDFSVYDYRVRGQLGLKPIWGIKKYFSYFLPEVQKVKVLGSLRDKDKFLWGKSFYEDLQKLLKE